MSKLNFKASHIGVESYSSASAFAFVGSGTIKVKLGFQDQISKCWRAWALRTAAIRLAVSGHATPHCWTKPRRVAALTRENSLQLWCLLSLAIYSLRLCDSATWVQTRVRWDALTSTRSLNEGGLLLLLALLLPAFKIRPLLKHERRLTVVGAIFYKSMPGPPPTLIF